jgi:hypothetical protein
MIIGGVVLPAHIFVELPASTFAENARPIVRQYYKFIERWFCYLYFLLS